MTERDWNPGPTVAGPQGHLTPPPPQLKKSELCTCAPSPPTPAVSPLPPARSLHSAPRPYSAPTSVPAAWAEGRVSCNQEGSVVRGGSPQPPGPQRGDSSLLTGSRAGMASPPYTAAPCHWEQRRERAVSARAGDRATPSRKDRVERKQTPPRGRHSSRFQADSLEPSPLLPPPCRGWAPTEAGCPGSLSGRAMIGTLCHLSPKPMLFQTCHSLGPWQWAEVLQSCKDPVIPVLPPSRLGTRGESPEPTGMVTCRTQSRKHESRCCFGGTWWM